VFYYDTLDGGRTVSWFLRLSLHAGRMYAKVTAQKINLTLSSSYPKIVCLPRISESGPAARATAAAGACRHASARAARAPCARTTQAQGYGTYTVATGHASVGGAAGGRCVASGSHATNQAGMPTAAMVPSCARQPSGRRAAAEPERYLPQQKLDSQRDADIGSTPAQRGVRGGVKSPAHKDGAKQLRLGAGYANSLPTADGYHEPHKLGARRPKPGRGRPVLAVPNQ
jgi:hypothetical protein